MPRGESKRARSKQVWRPSNDESDLECLGAASDEEVEDQDFDDWNLTRAMPELVRAYTVASDTSGLTLGMPRR